MPDDDVSVRELRNHTAAGPPPGRGGRARPRDGRSPPKVDLHAPHLLDVEVLSALRRLVAAGQASAERAEGAVADLLDLPIERYPHDLLLPRAWELRENVTAYDAVYVALAEAISDDPVALLTTDARLARAAREHSAVEVILAG